MSSTTFYCLSARKRIHFRFTNGPKEPSSFIFFLSVFHVWGILNTKLFSFFFSSHFESAVRNDLISEWKTGCLKKLQSRWDAQKVLRMETWKRGKVQRKLRSRCRPTPGCPSRLNKSTTWSRLGKGFPGPWNQQESPCL